MTALCAGLPQAHASPVERSDWEPLFGLAEEAILKKVQTNVTSRSLCEKEKGAVTDCLLTR